MEISGKVIAVLDMQSGEGKTGKEWKKQDFVIETVTSKFPKNIAFTVWGDKIEQFNIQMESDVVASIEIESREYNGKYYTNITAWDVKIDDTAAKGAPADMPAMPEFNDDDADDLPF